MGALTATGVRGAGAKFLVVAVSMGEGIGSDGGSFRAISG